MIITNFQQYDLKVNKLRWNKYARSLLIKIGKAKQKKRILETVTNCTTFSLLEDSFRFLVIHNPAKEDEVLNCP